MNKWLEKLQEGFFGLFKPVPTNPSRRTFFGQAAISPLTSMLGEHIPPPLNPDAVATGQLNENLPRIMELLNTFGLNTWYLENDLLERKETHNFHWVYDRPRDRDWIKSELEEKRDAIPGAVKEYRECHQELSTLLQSLGNLRIPFNFENLENNPFEKVEGAPTELTSNLMAQFAGHHQALC